MSEIKVIIVDDHPVARQGLLAIFKTEPTIRVLAEAGNAQEAISKVIAMKPDIAVLDIEMKRDTKDGFAIAHELRDKGFTGAIIFLTHSDKKYSLEKFLSTGEKGYIIKNDLPKQIIEGIKAVASGHPHISAEMLEKLPAYYNQKSIKVGDAHLTPREIEVLDLLIEYATNKEIGQRLDRSHRTVEMHLQNLRSKLELPNRDALITWWLENRSLFPRV
jgi:DNA-binding NarL/FixJ family response regulator